MKEYILLVLLKIFIKIAVCLSVQYTVSGQLIVQCGSHNSRWIVARADCEIKGLKLLMSIEW